jgi:hypothetical protein
LKRIFSIEEFERRFDAGEDITPYLDLSTLRRVKTVAPGQDGSKARQCGFSRMDG